MTNTQVKLLKVVAALRCVSTAQLTKIFHSVPHTTFVRSVRWLVDADLLDKMTHRKKNYAGYLVTQAGYRFLYGPDDIRVPATRPSDIVHTLLVNDVLMELSRYKFISSFIPEHEMTPDSLQSFIVMRRPDAIVSIKSDSDAYEIALEVERSRKTQQRIDEILDRYEVTFEKDMQCYGVIIVTTSDEIFKAYKLSIEKRAGDFNKRVLLVDINDINKLNENVYGQRSSKMDFVRLLGGLEVHEGFLQGPGLSVR